MNCQSTRRRLLALECPTAPPAELHQHLADCPACQSWHEQLAGIERDVPRLPVPPPTRREAFLEQLAGEASLPPRPYLPLPTRRERGLRKMAVAVALAASLLVIASAVWFGRPDGTGNGSRVEQPAVKDPLARLLDDDPRWQQAATPRERVVILDQLANDVEGKALALARASRGKQLADELALYRRVIDALADTEAPQTSRDERNRLLTPIANRLSTFQREALRLARETPESSVSLLALADVADEGHRKLRALLA